MILEKQDGAVCFQVDCINGETFFIDAEQMSLEQDFIEVPLEAMCLIVIPPSQENGGKASQGLLNVKEYKGVTSPIYIGKLGIAMITQVMSETPMGKAIIGSRSGLIV